MDISRHIFDVDRRALPPHRHYRKRELAYMAAAAALALFAWHGGDRPEDRIMEPLPAAQLCPKLSASPYGHLFLRWQIEHRYATGFHHHRCAYGPVWLEAARQEGM